MKDSIKFDTEYWATMNITEDWHDCKCQGNGWCEYHDDFDPENDSHAV